MNSIVIFASHHGNTMKMAEAIAAELSTHGSAQLLPAEYVPATLPKDIDLVIVGGPTEAHHMTEPLARFLGSLDADAFKGVAAAAFDTRLKGPGWLWGSAAAGIATWLSTLGARLVQARRLLRHGSVRYRGRRPDVASGRTGKGKDVGGRHRRGSPDRAKDGP